MVPLAAAGETTGPDKKASAPPKTIQVILSCSAERLDPLKPGDHHLKCTVRNLSDRPIDVPVFYSGGYDADLKLRAAARWELTLVKWAGLKKDQKKTLAPGKEMVVFQDTLRNLFLLDVKDAKSLTLKPREERYYWSWSA
jgi:hypothetical protein